MNTQPIAIAIDGPSGAGKSTIAKTLARELHFVYVDTGALYRAIGLAALRGGMNPAEEPSVTALLPSLSVSFDYAADGTQRVYLNGADVSDDIRTPAVSQAASAVSAIPAVRAFLLELQRGMARRQSVIMDGRDIGTVVLPQAQIKIFLTASAEDRARRRYDELCERGQSVTYEQVLAEMKERDERDSSRAVAPLRPAEDAVPVDTSGNTLEQSVALLTQIVRERLL